MMRTPRLVRASAARPRMPRVWSVSGVCSVMKSARASSVSRSAFSTPNSIARSGVRNGSKAMTFILSPSARLATIDPILPAPISPSVLPVTSTPMKRFFSHLPAWVEASASGSCRASANISAMACSAVVIELPNGVFMTTTPRAVAAEMSTLSTPIPARPTTLSRAARSSNLAVTLVDERIANPSYWSMIAASSSGVLPVISSTSMPRSRKMAAARGSIASEMRTLTVTWSAPRHDRATARGPRCRRCRRSRRTRCAGRAGRRDSRRCRRRRPRPRAAWRSP